MLIGIGFVYKFILFKQFDCKFFSKMLLLPFLNDRQIGSIRKTRPFSSDWRPNLDCLLSRLVCSQEDVYVTHEEGFPAPPFSCKFRKDKESDLLAVSNEEGDIYLINTDRGKGIVKEFRAHNNAIFDICWLPDKYRLLTGGGDFYTYLFDMNTCKRIGIYSYHSASIKSLDVCPGENGTIFAAGSKDGNISVWDIRETNLNLKPAISINGAHGRLFDKGRNKSAETIKSSVSAVAFKDCHNLASVGVADSNIKVWDLRKTYVTRNNRPHHPRYKINFSDAGSESFGFTSLVFDSLYNQLYACSTTNTISQVDCHSYNKKNLVQYSGFRCSSYFVKMALSCDDQYLLCGSSDNKAYIWKVSKPGAPIYELPGHSEEVTAVAWGSYNNSKLVTCGDDMKVFVWKTKYLEDANCKYNKEVVAISKPYSKDDSNSSCIRHKLAINSITQSVTFIDSSNPTPQKLKSPPTSDITHFFSPIATPPTSRHASADHNKTSPPQQISLTPSPRQPLSPRKNLLSNGVAGNSKFSPPALRSPGKENGTGNAVVESGAKLNGQLKRKLELNDRCCKFHPDGCGRTRGHTRCGKKITAIVPKKNIKNYFSVSPE